ncbi:MAG: hypothetical protein K1060chlam4_00301 [Candidatus Anoxychlamydiales bacterium]|nr:hypothetical protein [Candidatus Anoxychlamydiales bacterium]
MPIVGVKICGAKCRTKGGAPCQQSGMKNGRCRMPGGVFFRRETHGRTTLRAKEKRKKERDVLREIKVVNKEISRIEMN